MNWYIFIAGLIATAATVGHLSVGRKKFLKPMLAASFDPIPKKTDALSLPLRINFFVPFCRYAAFSWLGYLVWHRNYCSNLFYRG